MLGAGPAGLIAAHAATTAGCAVIIASKIRKSEMFGAQYLHAPIPGMTDVAPVEVRYALDGTPDEYRAKVYGKTSRVPVSPETLEKDHTAWDIRRTYDNLWLRYGPDINGITLEEGDTELEEMIKALAPDHVFSTVPAQILCRNDDHAFYAEKVWAIGDAPEKGIFCPIAVEANTIQCNGTGDVSWYRASNVFGYSTAEWSGSRPPIEGLSRVTKPIRTDCDCHPGITRLGRYGKWTKGVLSHEAYEDTLYELNDARLF